MTIVKSIRLPKKNEEDIRIEDLMNMFNQIAKCEKSSYRMYLRYGYPHICKLFLGFIPINVAHIYYYKSRDDEYFENITPFSDSTLIRIEKILQTMPIAWKVRLECD